MELDEIHARQIKMLRVIADICEMYQIRYYLIGGTLLGAVRHQGFIPWDDDIDIGMPRGDYDRFWAVARSHLPVQYALVDYRTDWRLPYAYGKLVDRQTELFETSIREEYRVRLGVYIDIFPLDGVPSHPVARWWHYLRIRALRWLIISNVLDNRGRRFSAKRLTRGMVQSVLRESAVKRIQRRLDEISRAVLFDESEEVCNYSGAWGYREFMPRSWVGNGELMSFEGVRVRAIANWDAYLKRLYGSYMELPPEERRMSPHSFAARRAD